MTQMKRFNLPDLGEGLQEAEIVRWHVAVGEHVKVDQPMVAVETAKAIVEVPSPFDGTIVALHGKPGDTIGTGAPLVDFSLSTPAAQAADAEPAVSQGGVVGRMPESNVVIQGAAGRYPAPGISSRASRACCPRPGATTNIDLDGVQATGRDGLITLDDVLKASTPAAATPLRRASLLPPARCGRQPMALNPARSRCCAACDAPWHRA